MRAFLALNFLKKERRRLHRAAGALRDRDLPVRWIDPDHYHMTLKFLGDLGEARIEPVREVMAGVAATTPPFVGRFGAWGAYPTIRLPEVLWIGVEASPELRCLKQDLEWGLAEHGFGRETRAFHPHVTLGRAPAEAVAGAFRGLDDLVAELDPPGDFSVRAIDLMRSSRVRGEVRYSVIESVRLAGG
ncbi:MAG: RNA 2',3'-cyclic phosphodiesterase [Longimicrobiales bacterium]|nr:RNA 2',3'-cyclic phosphodiesterase [Longimicrobiales bacterium]